MVQEMVVTLREGGETSLMLALLFSTLKAAGHATYRAAAWVGFAAALVLSICAGVLIHDVGSLDPIFEAGFAWLGAGFIASLAVQLHFGAGNHRTALKQIGLSATTPNASWATAFAIGSFAFVSVVREGLETAVFLSNGETFVGQGRWLGAGVGLALAAAFGVAIYLGFRKLNIRAFMKTTEILLLALVLSLFLTGLHEFAEAGVLTVPRSIDLAYVSWLRGGLFLGILLCVAPFVYLALAKSPPRHFATAALLSGLLALTPSGLEQAARSWEHWRLSPPDRVEAARVEAAVQRESRDLVTLLAALCTNVSRGEVDAARRAWVDARGRYVALEPLLGQMDPELASELNGEPGEAGGFHGVESTLFAVAAPWVKSPAALARLRGDLNDLLARARVATGILATGTWEPARVRAAWSSHRWILLRRIDGEESAASQTSILEFASSLDALDTDLGSGAMGPSVFPSAPLRRVLGSAFAEARRGPRYGEYRDERVLASESSIHVPLRRSGPDRVWEGVDRDVFRRALLETFAQIGSTPEARGRKN